MLADQVIRRIPGCSKLRMQFDENAIREIKFRERLAARIIGKVWQRVETGGQ
jgi:hypothetical protein